LRTEVPRVKTAVTLDPAASASAWTDSVSLPLTWDVPHQRAAADATEVHVASDDKYLYVRFDAMQRTPVVTSQQSDDLVTGGSIGNNGNIAWSDDAVWVDLWPTGPGGFQYQFEANAGGSHNEASTENMAFAPRWESHGVTRDGGYTVTMAIPLAVIHGPPSGAWRAQFIRYVRNTGAMYVWSYDGLQTSPDDAARAGVLTMPTTTAKAARPAPRLAPYTLGSIASAGAGGSTSRVGADLSIPVTQTSSFYSTFHPDYSNVELDQQTIAPTVVQRVFTEVRPFLRKPLSFTTHSPAASAWIFAPPCTRRQYRRPRKAMRLRESRAISASRRSMRSARSATTVRRRRLYVSRHTVARSSTARHCRSSGCHRRCK
jgi:hypothetical protein